MVYDVALNAFFCSADMLRCAPLTQQGYARDLAAFLTFLWSGRAGRGWRDATAEDHSAYLVWRRFDEAGPHVAASTWNREVAAVNRFYVWQMRARNLATNPIPQMASRRPYEDWGSDGGQPVLRPATYSHAGSRERVQWLTAEAYRRWRDVGVRGYSAAGLPDPAFRGRWASRNAVFCDLLVRTGMRLSEQAGLTVFEVPTDRGVGGYTSFRLSPALAKGGSSRVVYVPASVITDLVGYATTDRAEVVARAQAAGRYRQLEAPIVMADASRSVARISGGRRVPVAALSWAERQRLLVEGPGGLEPAAFWLSEDGLPMAVSSWKSMFRVSNERCARHGVPVRAYAHMLRHTFAVITLEQLQRGLIAELADSSPAQRGQYVRVFGDPLDWVRRRLGHRSVVTTQIYLHALAELEMATRMALVPDGWDDPRGAAMAADGDPGTPTQRSKSGDVVLAAGEPW